MPILGRHSSIFCIKKRKTPTRSGTAALVWQVSWRTSEELPFLNGATSFEEQRYYLTQPFPGACVVLVNSITAPGILQEMTTATYHKSSKLRPKSKSLVTHIPTTAAEVANSGVVRLSEW